MNAKEVRAMLETYIKRIGSQRKAATALEVGTATISDIVQGNFSRVSNDMLATIRAKISPVSRDWSIVETDVYKEISSVLLDSKLYGDITWVVADAGSGKTTTSRHFAENTTNAFYILCSEDMIRGSFLGAICKAIGIKSEDNNRSTLDAIFQQLLKLESPVLIFDEADKLQDTVFQYYVHIYNILESHVGMVFLSTNYIEKRMSSGLRNNKRGYKELNSRIGRKFFKVDPVSANDIYAICKHNGIEDKEEIERIIKDADNYDYDLRRVKKFISVVKRA